MQPPLPQLNVGSYLVAHKSLIPDQHCFRGARAESGEETVDLAGVLGVSLIQYIRVQGSLNNFCEGSSEKSQDLEIFQNFFK